VKVAVTGANGQLGTDLCQALNNFDVIPLTHADIEIADMASVREAMLKPKAVKLFLGDNAMVEL